jgi:hypothetical protein
LTLNDDHAGKAEGIRPKIGCPLGNSTGDRQTLEYTKTGDAP